MNRKSYLTNCTSASGDSIRAMQDDAREVAFRTVCKHIEGGAATLNEMFGTDPRVSQDWAVSFYKSTFEGRPCVYVRHSSIEYIFV